MYTYIVDFKPVKYSDFHVGMRVEDRRGRKGIIKFIKPHSDGLLVEYDEVFPNGHDGNGIYNFGRGDHGKCWWHNLGDVKPLKNEYEVNLL